MDVSSYLSESLYVYLKDLSDKKMVPGGGSAAALVASVGAALNMMVLNYSIKKDNASKNEDLIVLKARQDKILETLVKIIDEDCIAFEELMSVLKDGADAEDKYKRAAGVPMRICRESCSCMEIALFLVEAGNKNLITDVGCAVHMLEGAFFSALYNVRVNLKYIKDNAFKAGYETELGEMSKMVKGSLSEIEQKLDAALRI
ncbi:MAG TPA: cyclodeaminase/cyclohydrolase family protein [Candidatus Omnitrophota bacterium]|nr:cyclodeaminase/cyclohydrolase family protein [Candidatus Omnitrophota bacterium]HPS19947.1 cyclodeaminase/cyclohydrolase family protein [Candidatus Omnitrophota bacterium]